MVQSKPYFRLSIFIAFNCRKHCSPIYLHALSEISLFIIASTFRLLSTRRVGPDGNKLEDNLQGTSPNKPEAVVHGLVSV